MEKEFHNFYDIIRSYPLYRGKGSTAYDDSAESSRYAGTFKGRITVRTGGDSEIETVHHLPTKDLCPVIIRVYVIEVHAIIIVNDYHSAVIGNRLTTIGS